MVLKCVHEFMGYIIDSYRFYGFGSDSDLRNTLGIEKSLLVECTLSSDVAIYKVTPPRV